MSRFELTISTGYVPDWTYIEAVREIFQNALDNETVNKENEMFVTYNEDSNVLRIGNKTSKLDLKSLLLGDSTKRDDKNTIGKHGEGYKIALMVLLREGRTVKVYNYGAREVWDCKIIKSRRFGADIVAIDVNKKYIWDNVPDNDLVFELGVIEPTEYEAISETNLHLKPVDETITTTKGYVLKDSGLEGKIFVNGLYVCTESRLNFGYNFNPEFISLDRDRRMVNTFDLQWLTSKIWAEYAQVAENADFVVDLVNKEVFDVHYISNHSLTVFKEKLMQNFTETNGANAVPVCTNGELARVAGLNGVRPVLVSSNVYNMIGTDFEAVLDDAEPTGPSDISLSEEMAVFLLDNHYSLDRSQRNSISYFIKRARFLEGDSGVFDVADEEDCDKSDDVDCQIDAKDEVCD